ncbi:glycosyltransferase family 2 protein [Devosia honganensis]|uniref:Glycosyltransferase family 2 protein n=1 Tax=Devosia honganensis TaxID=1610527 RepID=A0ABV7WZH7_9HYPH
MTTYNAGQSVARLIYTALEQDWRPIEIVIVDDASTDASWEAISSLAAAHPEVRAFRQEVNRGVGAARNRIVKEARGAFIAFFDDDDESVPERVRLQVRRIVDYEARFAGGAPVICHSARRQIMLDGKQRIETTMGERAGVAAPHGRAVARRILAGDTLEDGYGALATCSQMARTETYRQLGGFDPAFRRVEDTEFCVRLALAGGHFVGIGAPLVTQTLTKTSDKSLEAELGYKLMLIDKHREVFDGERHYRYCRDWAVTKYHWLARHRAHFALRMLAAASLHPRLTWQRLRLAVPNLEGNRAFSAFHRAGGE